MVQSSEGLKHKTISFPKIPCTQVLLFGFSGWLHLLRHRVGGRQKDQDSEGGELSGIQR